MGIYFYCKHYDELSKEELYGLLSLRSEVFIIEQNCIFQDIDYLDQHSWHVIGTDINGKITAHSRLIPQEKLYKECSIGRVCIRLSERKTGMGRKLMQYSMEQCSILFGNPPIKIMAQEYLQGFYESFGFRQTSDPFLEDGIPHIGMHCYPA